MLEGDIYGMISPYATANFWWWPYLRKFHLRYYDPIPDGFSNQEGFQSTFSVTKAEADIAKGLLDSGKWHDSRLSTKLRRDRQNSRNLEHGR